MSRMYFVYNNGGQSPNDAVEELRQMEIKPHMARASSVENGMFEAYWSEAIRLADLTDEERDELHKKVSEIIRVTPYTNWSGD